DGGTCVAVGKQPVDEEEDEDAGNGGEHRESNRSQGLEDDVLALAEKDEMKHRLIAGRSAHRRQCENARNESQQQRDKLIAQIRTILGEPPNLIESDLQRHEYACGGYEKNDQRSQLYALAGLHQGGQVSDDELLPCRQMVAKQLNYHIRHVLRVEDVTDQPHDQHHKGKERKDSVCGYGKGKSMSLCL